MARGGRDGISARISLDGGDEVKRQLADLGKEGEKALRDLSAATSGASTSLAGISNIARDLQLVFGRMGGLGAVGGGAFLAIASAASSMTTALGATIAVVAGATAGLLALAVSGANAASEIKEGANRIGSSAENYSKLKFAFEQSGSSAEGFEKAMAIILDAANDAAAGAAKAAEDVEKANEKITQSSIAAADEAKKRSRDLAQALLGNSQSLSKDLRQIAVDEAREIAALTERPLTEREAIEKRSAQRREDAMRAAAERQAEIEEKAAQAAREARIKRNKEQQDELAAFNKAIADNANKTSSAFEKLGVNLLNAAGDARDPTNAFKDIAEAMSKIEDPAKRSALAIELFKRRVGPQLTEMLSEGKAGIKELEDEAERLGLTFREIDPKIGKSLTDIGKHFQDTMSALGNTVGATTAKIGLAFAPMFDGLISAWTAKAGATQGAIVAFARSVADAIKPIFDDLTNLISGNTDKIGSLFIRTLIPVVQALGVAFTALATGIGAAFVVIGAVLDGYAAVLNAVFGVKITGTDIPVFAAAIYLSIKAVSLLGAAFTFLTGAAAPWLLILGAIAIAVGLLLMPLDKLKPLLTSIFGEEMAASITGFLERAGKQWNDAWTAMSDWVRATIRVVITFFQPLLDVIRAVKDAFSGMPAANAPAATAPIPTAAGGGYIRGPGSGTSDSILSRLSNGEYVIKARAVQHFGVGIFEALNRLRMPKFSLGGLVEGLSRPLMTTPRFAGGGLVAAPADGAGGTAFTLVIDNRPFDVSAPSDVAEQLIRFARGRAMLSAGKKPGWST